MITLLLALTPLALDPSAAVRGARPVELAGPHGFLENGGQWSREARFRGLGAGVSSWFVDDGWWLVLRDGTGGAALSMSFEDAGPTRPRPSGALPGRHHFMRGPDPDAFVLGLRTWERLRWPGLLEGVDLVVRAPRAGTGTDTGGLFEYDLELAAGAELERVRVRVQGHQGLALDDRGRLVVSTAAGELVQSPPVAWQDTPAGPVRFTCRFRLIDGERYGFEAPERDPALPAVIDPALIFSTYLSGTGEQLVERVAVAPNGDVVAAGTCESDSFPTTPGAFQELAQNFEDAFVTRLTPGGQMIWSTYLAGTTSDLLRGMAVDANGAVTVCGDTNSADFPSEPGSFQAQKHAFLDGFCLRLAPTGDALEFGTFLGGSLNDRAADLAIDASGSTTVVGTTNGGNFPSTPGSYDPTFNGGVFGGDAFCLRLDPAGQLEWSTFIGGSSDEGATAVAVEATGEVTVAGVASGSFPMSPGAYSTIYSPPGQAWVVRLDALGANRVYGTWLGALGLEEITSVALDGSGASVLAGRVEGSNYPTTPGAPDTTFGGSGEGFVTRLNATGSALEWSTFVGGDEDDEVTGLALDATGRVVAVGTTLGSGVTTTPGAYDLDYNASLFGQFGDGFVVRLAPDGQSIDYGSYFGTDAQDDLRAVALDPTGVAVLGGGTFSYGFPTTPGALQEGPNFGASREGFVTYFAFLRHPIPYGTGTPPGSGGTAIIDYLGFPDLATNDFTLEMHAAPSGTKAILFHGFAPQASPFYSGTIYVLPPLKRARPVKTDVFGYAKKRVDLDAAWVGSTVYFQWWFEDPLLKKSAGLSNALEVSVYP